MHDVSPHAPALEHYKLSKRDGNSDIQYADRLTLWASL